jgi:hypothetical protein
MPLPARVALAFALSLAAGGAVQQALMVAYDSGAAPGALAPLGGCILLVTIVFGVVLWRRPAAIGWTAAIMLAAMLVFGVAVYSFGVNDLRPGIGGNIGYLIAMLVVFDFLLPSALAVPIHWLLLRGARNMPTQRSVVAAP